MGRYQAMRYFSPGDFNGHLRDTQ